MQKLYMLAALLPGPMEELILQFKREIAERYQSVAALKPMDHIVLVDTFLLDEAKLPRLELCLNEVFGSVAPFEVELENFGAFPPHTIFAAIKDFFPLQHLRSRLAKLLEREFQLVAENRGSTPHIPVAHRDLQPEAFDAAWVDFSARELTASFRLESVHLLEQRGKWRSIREFLLGGQKFQQAPGRRAGRFCA